jgi:hypothetical protein
MSGNIWVAARLAASHKGARFHSQSVSGGEQKILVYWRLPVSARLSFWWRDFREKVMRWEVKMVKRWEMGFVTSSRSKFSRGFTGSDWNFNANIGRMALGWKFYLKFWGDILGWNFDGVQLGYSNTNLIEFSSEPRKTYENVDITFRSEDFPDADWLLASCQSQSQSYFTVYRQPIPLGAKLLEDYDQRFLLQLNPCSHSNILSDRRMGLSLVN